MLRSITQTINCVKNTTQRLFCSKPKKELKLESSTTLKKLGKKSITPKKEEEEKKTVPSLGEQVILSEQSSFVRMSSCVIDYIIGLDNLTYGEKLYYLIVTFYDSFLDKWKDDDTKFSANAMGKEINISRSRAFSIQRSLEEKGCLIVERSSDKFRRNNVNVSISTVNHDVAVSLLSEKRNLCNNYKNTSGIIDEIKNARPEEIYRIIQKYTTYIPINTALFRSVFFHDKLSHSAKILFIKIFSNIHRIKLKHGHKSYVGGMEIKNLMKETGMSESTIRRGIKELTENNIITKKLIRVQNEDESCNRFDRPINNFGIIVPKKLSNINKVSEPGLSKSDPSLSQTDPKPVINRPHNTYRNKHKKIDLKKIVKNVVSNIDGSNLNEESMFKIIEAVMKEVKLSNQTDKQKSSKGGIKSKPRFSWKSGPKKLADFYPLSKEDASELVSRSGRNFTLNAQNEILLDLSKKHSDPSFSCKKNFMSYMVKVLQNELRSVTDTAHSSFKIRNNMSDIEKENAKHENFLCKIENQSEVSPEWHFKKKIASSLKASSAYNLLYSLRSINLKKGTFNITLNRDVSLSEAEKRIILKEAKASHEGIMLQNGQELYVQELQITINQKSQSEPPKNDYQVRFSDDVWGEVKKTLFARFFTGKQHAINMEKSWFSEVEMINDESGKLKLKAPDKFRMDWIKDNYESLIRQSAHEHNCQLDRHDWITY